MQKFVFEQEYVSKFRFICTKPIQSDTIHTGPIQAEDTGEKIKIGHEINKLWSCQVEVYQDTFKKREI